MRTFEISGSTRTEIGKRFTKALRAEGKVPCVLYGGEKNIHFQLTVSELTHLIYSPNVYLIDLTIDGKPAKAIIQDIQFHPVSDAILHIDFFQISEDKPVIIEIPVALHGLAPGVKEGGKLSLRARKLKVKALYTALPDVLDINISKLKLGSSIKVGDLNYEGLELLNAKNAVICSVNLTRAARGLAAAEGEEGEETEGEEVATEEASE